MEQCRGFTLVELLTVVAVIAILVVVATLQYAAHRLKTQNATALADLKNLKTSLEVFFGEHHRYP